MKKVSTILLATLLTVSLISCKPTTSSQIESSQDSQTSQEVENPVRIISIKGTGISNKELTLNKGESLKLTYVVSPSNASNKNDIAWSSSNENIATISQEGLLTAVGVGSCEIKAQIGTVHAEIKLTVNDVVPLQTISFKKANYEIKASNAAEVEMDMKNEIALNPTNATYKSVKWSLTPIGDANAEHLTVSADGVLNLIKEKAIENAQYLLKVESTKDSSVYATTTITIKYIEAESFKIRFSHEPAPRNPQTYAFPTTYSMYQKLNINPEVLPLGAMDKFTFTSTNPEVVSVTQGYKDAFANFKVEGKVGVATINVVSKRNPSITSSVTFNIVEPEENDKYVILNAEKPDENLNISKADLDSVKLDSRTYWNFDPEGEKYASDRKASLANWKNIAPIGSTLPPKEMMNSGNGQSIFDGGYCVCFDSWDWPADNEQTNLYFYNRVEIPNQPLLKARIRTQATAGTTGKGKFRIRLVNPDTYEYVFLEKDGAFKVEGFLMEEYRSLKDTGRQDLNTGWIYLDSVPDFDLAQDWFYFSIPEKFKGKQTFIFVEVDDIHTSLDLGTDGCDRIQLICMYFVDKENKDPNSFR